MAKKQVKRSSKLANLFSKPKNVILLVFIIAFAGIGVYKVYQSSAYSKSPYSLSNCYQLMALGEVHWPKEGDDGACITTLASALNGLRPSHNYDWPFIYVNSHYGSDDRAAVMEFQKSTKGALAVDGYAGPQTMAYINTLCASSSGC